YLDRAICLKGKPVGPTGRSRRCPAAVCGNDLRHEALGLAREAANSREDATRPASTSPKTCLGRRAISVDLAPVGGAGRSRLSNKGAPSRVSARLRIARGGDHEPRSTRTGPPYAISAFRPSSCDAN